MRIPAALLILATLTLAGDGTGLPAEERAALVRIYGGSAKWAELPRWRQEMIEANYADILRLPPETRRAILADSGRLREKLLRPRRVIKRDALPDKLRRDVERLPKETRGMAARLAMMRLRQLRLDRGLARVPRAQRWALFRRLFPEPFDAAGAREAYRELRAHLKRDLTAKLMTKLRHQGIDPKQHPEKASRLLKEIAGADERAVTTRIRKELFEFKDSDPRRIRRILEKRGFFISERPSFATPREKELIRYCLVPHECPLVDMRFLGPRPRSGPARQAWDHDYQYLARLDLLFEARFPREMVLHLAATGTPEDFLRALKMLRRPRQIPGKSADGRKKGRHEGK